VATCAADWVGELNAVICNFEITMLHVVSAMILCCPFMHFSGIT